MTALKPRAINESIWHKTVLMNKTRIEAQARDSAVAWSCHSTHRSTHRSTHFSLFTVLCLLFRRLSPCHCICTHHISCLLARFVWEPGPLCRPRASCWVSRLRCCHFAPRTKPDKGTLNFEQTRHASIKAPEPQELSFYYSHHRLDESLSAGPQPAPDVVAFNFASSVQSVSNVNSVVLLADQGVPVKTKMHAEMLISKRKSFEPVLTPCRSYVL